MQRTQAATLAQSVHCLSCHSSFTGRNYAVAVYGDLASTTPQGLRDGFGVADVVGGASHALALLANGSILAWENGAGALDGQAVVPPFPPGRTAVQVAAGGNFSAALLDDGSLLLWGANDFGQATVPPRFFGVTATYIAAGARHVLACLSNGTVAGFGDNSFGQLNIPLGLLQAEAGVTQVAGGSFHSLAVTAEGRVYAWGDDQFGQISVPWELQGGGVQSVAAGTDSSCAVMHAGTSGDGGSAVDGSHIVCWGKDEGQGRLESLSGVVQVVAGSRHFVARLQTGEVHAAGSNQHGQVRVRPGAATAAC
jgi:alpha-tubulin suppressor-like RCC1 family protein